MEDNRRKREKKDIDKWFRITYIRTNEEDKEKFFEHRIINIVRKCFSLYGGASKKLSISLNVLAL